MVAGLFNVGIGIVCMYVEYMASGSCSVIRGDCCWHGAGAGGVVQPWNAARAVALWTAGQPGGGRLPKFLVERTAGGCVGRAWRLWPLQLAPPYLTLTAGQTALHAGRAMPASPAVAAPWSPDVYSRAFVPAYLHAVNAQPAIICVSLSPPHINFHAFIAAFSGAALLRPLPPPRWPLPPSPPLPLPLARPASPARAPTLTPDSYAVHFFALLAREFDTQRQELRRYDLYNVPLAVQDPAQMLVRVQVPGLRENMPPVQLGDLVHLRKILPPYAYPGYPGGFTGYQYDTFVYGLDKTEGFIVLRADNLILEPGAGFNVCFVCQEKAWHGAARAIDDVDVELKRVCSAPANGALATLVLPGHDRTSSPATPSAGSSPAPLPAQSFLKRMLFPQKEDGVWQTGLSKGVFRRSWFDTDLNYEQQVRRYDRPSRRGPRLRGLCGELCGCRSRFSFFLTAPCPRRPY